jgi:hypothetical protein
VKTHFANAHDANFLKTHGSLLVSPSPCLDMWWPSRTRTGSRPCLGILSPTITSPKDIHRNLNYGMQGFYGSVVRA